MTPDPRIPRLLALWHRVIGPLHHKDRDCHFRISAHWCAYRRDGRPEWELEHDGYLIQGETETFPTYEAAEARLIEVLAAGIREWLDLEEPEHPEHVTAGILSEVAQLVGRA